MDQLPNPPFEDYPRPQGEPWHPGDAAAAAALQALMDGYTQHHNLERQLVGPGQLRELATKHLREGLAGSSATLGVLGKPASEPVDSDRYEEIITQLQRGPAELIFYLRASQLLRKIYDFTMAPKYGATKNRISYMLIALGRLVEVLALHELPREVIDPLVDTLVDILEYKKTTPKTASPPNASTAFEGGDPHNTGGSHF